MLVLYIFMPRELLREVSHYPDFLKWDKSKQNHTAQQEKETRTPVFPPNHTQRQRSAQTCGSQHTCPLAWLCLIFVTVKCEAQEKHLAKWVRPLNSTNASPLLIIAHPSALPCDTKAFSIHCSITQQFLQFLPLTSTEFMFITSQRWHPCSVGPSK